MVADRYARPTGLNPGAMALAMGASFVLLFGLSLSAPNFVKIEDPVFKIKSIRLPETPPEKPPEAKPQTRQKDTPTIDTPRPDPVNVTEPVVTTAVGGNTATVFEGPPNTEVVVGTGTGTTPATVHIPVIFGPELDARYADSFQPNYPAGERSAEREGRVVVRVLVGADGRVKAVEPVTIGSPAFFEATKRQALTKWRFRPGTRDGVAVEAWRTIGVRFELGAE